MMKEQYQDMTMQGILNSLHLPLGVDSRHLLFWATVILLWASSFGFPTPIATTPKKQPTGINHEKTVVIVYHKPPNVITSHSDAEALAAAKSGPRKTVYDDVQSLQGWVGRNKNNHPDASSWKDITGIQSKLHAVGRLDCDTTGLLLLTNDGGLVHHVTNPSAKETSVKPITKAYEALIMGHHEADCADFQTMRTVGVDIGAKYGGMTKPAIDLTLLDHPTEKTTLVSITIAEGKNRQVRRMFHSIGSGVMNLKRTRIGDHLNLEGLEVGQWRILSDKEINDALEWRVRRIEDKARKSRPKQKHRHGLKRKESTSRTSKPTSRRGRKV